ncbi:MAG: DUF1674 domain-containing protein [Woeseiaceae bacterium]|nr:DUF1674 domain-containing protein [Woeseiaceae bacterium]
MITPDSKDKANSSDSKPAAEEQSGSGAESEAGGTAEVAGDSRPIEIGGRAGPDPTRYGDWEKAGRCIDF